MNNPNNSHFLMAQIKTIEMFMNYPRLLIAKYDNEDFLKQEAEKEKFLFQNINNN